MVYFVRCFNGF